MNITVSVCPDPSSAIHVAVPAEVPELNMELVPVPGFVEAVEVTFETVHVTETSPIN